MELDITNAFHNLKGRAHYLSGSRAELGNDAGRITWQNSKDAAEEMPLLDTPGKLQAFKDWAGEFGAWDAAERAAWSDQETNALFLQWIAGDIRESRGLSKNKTDWRMHERDSMRGQCASNIYCANRRVYFYIGS